MQWLCIQLTTQLSEMKQASEGGEEKEEDEGGQADRVQEGRITIDWKEGDWVRNNSKSNTNNMGKHKKTRNWKYEEYKARHKRGKKETC